MDNVLTDPLAAARDDLERRIRAGTLHSADDLRDAYPSVWSQPNQALELVYTEYVLRVANGETPNRDDWYRRYPEWRDRLERLFGLNDLLTSRDTHRNQHDATLPVLAPDAVEQPDHPVGYELLGELGRGGMAIVYRARQLDLNRLVALKVLRGGAWFRDEDAVRIRREAEAAARLQHPNIVQIHEIGDWDGVPFLALEYVAGGTLGEFLARNQRQGTLGATPTHAAELVETLARAMHYAHEQGIVHRDLKPANVLLNAECGTRNAELKTESESSFHSAIRTPHSAIVPKIADFGLAVTLDVSQSLSQTGLLVGTPCYMAPEQADSRREAIGPRTDVYALGGILYEMLTGRPPFQGATVLETLELVRHAEPVAPRQLRPQVPRDLETICLKCLAKGPERRYDSAAALAEDLERFRTDRPILARPVSALERSVKWVKRNRGISALATVVVALLVASVGILLVSNQRISQSLTAETTANGNLASSLEREQHSNASLRLLMAAAVVEADDLDAARQQLVDVPPERRDATWCYLDRVVNAQLAGNNQLPALGFVTFSPDGTRIAAVQENAQAVLVFDATTAKPLFSATLLLPDSVIVGNVRFTPTSDHLNVITFVRETKPDGSLGAMKWTEVRTWTVAEAKLRMIRTARYPLPKVPYGMALAPDGRWMAVSEENDISIWEYGTTGNLMLLGRHAAPVVEVCLSRDGRFLASCDKNGGVKIWDVVNRSFVRELSGYKQVQVRGLFRNREAGDVSRDGKQFGFPGDRNLVSSLVRLVEADGLPGGRSLPAHRGSVNCVRFSPDGRSLASAGGDGLVKLWDLASGQTWLTLRADKIAVHALDFSSDGKRLVTTSTDGKLRIWDVRPFDE